MEAPGGVDLISIVPPVARAGVPAVAALAAFALAWLLVLDAGWPVAFRCTPLLVWLGPDVVHPAATASHTPIASAVRIRIEFRILKGRKDVLSVLQRRAVRGISIEQYSLVVSEYRCIDPDYVEPARAVHRDGGTVGSAKFNLAALPDMSIGNLDGV